MDTRPHKKLIVWQKAVDLVVIVYDVTKHFPREELYGLSSQCRRAAVSVPSNIAEGLVRKSTLDKLHFLNIALSSLSELDTQLEIALRLNFIEAKEAELLNSKLVEIHKLLSGLINSIKK